jgi:phthiocerol/phenolphthiocerol synthesis type-I polyketide synthase E
MKTSQVRLEDSEESSTSKDSSQREESSRGLTLLPGRVLQNENTLLKSFSLPNGLKVFHQNAAQTNIIYAEIFDAQVYLQYGIKLPKQACVFDVGAHIGLFSLFIHQQRNDARIFAFEPVFASYQALCQNIKYHSIQATLLNYGLSHESIAMPLVFFPSMAGMSGLFADPQKDKEAFKVGIRHWMQEDGCEPTLAWDLDELAETFFAQSDRQICQFKTLSEAMRENSVEHIDLLKIDVEGNEFEVLRGIEKQDWPKIEQIVGEIHNKKLLQQVVELLAEKRYYVTIEVEDGAVLEQFEQEGGYRLYMIYASREKRTSSERIQTVHTRRHRISSQELVRLLREDRSEQLR